MELIIGGAFQGKLDWARANLKIEDTDICACTPDAPADLTRRCLYHYENHILYCLRNGITPQLPPEDAVVIMDDIFCGVVPIDPEIRAWREACGRALTAVSQASDRVTRIFCGLPLQLK